MSGTYREREKRVKDRQQGRWDCCAVGLSQCRVPGAESERISQGPRRERATQCTSMTMHKSFIFRVGTSHATYIWPECALSGALICTSLSSALAHNMPAYQVVVGKVSASVVT